MANPELITYEPRIVRAAAILTTGYVAGTILTDCEKFNQLMVFVKFTIGSLSRVEIKIEFSFDGGSTYYQETLSTIDEEKSVEELGIHRFGDEGNYVIAIPIKCSKIKISAIGIGTVTSSSLKLDAVVGVS